MVERWVTAYGREAALKICEADQQEPAEGGMFADSGGDLPQMDDGSRLVAEIAAAAVPGAKRVWDCCAAPGGKTLILARRLAAAAVVATDVSAKRLAQTEARLRRYAYAERVLCAVADATRCPECRGDVRSDSVRCALQRDGDAGGESGDSAPVEAGGVCSGRRSGRGRF